MARARHQRCHTCRALARINTANSTPESSILQSSRAMLPPVSMANAFTLRRGGPDEMILRERNEEDRHSGSTKFSARHVPKRSALPAGNEATRLPGRPLRICLTSSEFLGPFRSGGIGTAYTKPGEAPKDAGHHAPFLYTNGRFTLTEPIEDWIVFYRRRGIRLVPLPESPVPFWYNTKSLEISYRVYRWLSEHDGFDIVHFPE